MAGGRCVVNEQTQSPRRSLIWRGRPGGLTSASPPLRAVSCLSLARSGGGLEHPSISVSDWRTMVPPPPTLVPMPGLESRVGQEPEIRRPRPLSAASPGARLTHRDQPCCREDTRGSFIQSGCALTRTLFLLTEAKRVHGLVSAPGAAS